MSWVNYNDFDASITYPVAFGKNNKTHFCHYTSVEAALSILESGFFYLSPFENMNDVDELKLHEDESKKIFSLCFCNSLADNIPLWYLYGGIDGKGVRIEFTAAKMRDLIRICEKSVYDLTNEVANELSSSEYELHYGWIYYEKGKNNVSYRGHPISKTDMKVYHGVRNSDNSIYYFIKGFPWRYEKEFRILVKIKKEGVKKVGIKFDFEKFKSGIRLLAAPEFSKSNEQTVAKFANIKKWDKKKLKGKSELRIQMNLLKRNFFKYVNSICEEKIIY